MKERLILNSPSCPYYLSLLSFAMSMGIFDSLSKGIQILSMINRTLQKSYVKDKNIC